MRFSVAGPQKKAHALFMGRKLPKIIAKGAGAYERETRPRGFHEENDPRPQMPAPVPLLPRVALFVRNGYRAEVCTGEAHTNAHIDNCMRCAPMWGVMAVKVSE